MAYTQQAITLSQPPTNDALVGVDKNMLPIWIDWISTLYQLFIAAYSQYGFFLPQLTTTQRNTIQSPVNGQMIYNTTIGSAQYYKAGVWTSF